MNLRVPSVEIGARLGSGAFGSVFRGRHRSLDIDVAVKCLDVTAMGPAEQARALREAQLMARLDHPNLLRVFDAGLDQGVAFLVLELMDGGSLHGVVHAPATRGVTVAMQLLSGVQALHDARILHRDIKPANCLVRARDQRIKLADLGLALEDATIAERGELAGTIPFMAPELFASPARYGTASDLYAVGMTLGCLLLPDPPYPRTSQGELVQWILNGARPRFTSKRPDLPSALATTCDRLIAPRIEDRPESAAAALAAIGQHLESEPPTVRISDAVTVVGPWLLGGTVYKSSNWHGRAVTHARTGAAGRLMHLQPDSALAAVSDQILGSAERAATLNHPGIVPVIDWGLLDRRPYVVTTARGAALDEVVRARGAYDEATSLRFAADLAGGLEFLHAQSLVYQNLDPGAAVASADARAAQLSWPVYCVEAGTSAKERIVVPRYAAPEALYGTALTIEREIDSFGLGAVLYFLLTGRGVPRSYDIREQLRHAAPEVTAPTAALVANLLAIDPARRPSSGAARQRLLQILNGLQAQ